MTYLSRIEAMQAELKALWWEMNADPKRDEYAATREQAGALERPMENFRFQCAAVEIGQEPK